jgi:hypothetical protein
VARAPAREHGGLNLNPNWPMTPYGTKDSPQLTLGFG